MISKTNISLFIKQIQRNNLNDFLTIKTGEESLKSVLFVVSWEQFEVILRLSSEERLIWWWIFNREIFFVRFQMLNKIKKLNKHNKINGITK